MLGLSEGDHLEVRVIEHRIVLVVALVKNEVFSPNTVAKLLMERLN